MARAVSKSAELMRIMALPKRDLGSENLTDSLTAYLKTESGTMALKDIQVAALREFYEYGGLFGPLAVGSGKTLVTLLSAVLAGAKRPLLLIPASLKKKTERELKLYSKHFRMPTNLTIMNYELLSRIRGQQEFEKLNPDLIIADECHRLKNAKAACTRRVARHMKAHPETQMVAVSGTMTSKSMMDYWHILKWCLKDRAPVPEGWREAKDWSLALDEKIPFEWERLKPGALTLLSNIPKENLSELQWGRNCYRDRLIKTPGVVATAEEELGTSLLVTTSVLKVPEKIEEHFRNLRETWTTPNGDFLTDSIRFYEYVNQIACGFYYKWKYPAPKEWIEARKEWAAFVRNVIATNKKNIDSEKGVALAVSLGQYPEDKYLAWKAVQDKFTPETECIWLSDHALTYCKKWADQIGGLIWTEHLGFGKEFERLYGIPFFSEGGLSKNGQYIEDHKGPAIVSIASNYQGKNLQFNWESNLIVNCPASGSIMEQLIGRTHRHGQESESVSVEIMLGCYEHYLALMQCIKDADYIKDTQKQIQKILYADKELITEDNVKKLLQSGIYSWKAK